MTANRHDGSDCHADARLQQRLRSRVGAGNGPCHDCAAVDPTTAIAAGLKVDADALPAAVLQGIQNGSVDLKSSDTIVTLLKLNAVVGVIGKVETVNGKDTLACVGISCALCHATVDNSFAPGIGKRLDGWANRDLNPGAIIALSPALSLTMKAVYNSWGKENTIPASIWTGKTARKSFRLRSA